MTAGAEMDLRLSDLLPWVSCPPLKVSGLCDESRAVCPGDVFLALAGSRCHGVEFALEAQAKGACAIVYDPKGARLPPGLTIPAIALPRLQERVGEIAARFYGYPSREMEIIGITGTNGKTSCSLFLAQALAGGVIGTLGWGRPPVLQPTAHTTAPAMETQRRLAALRVQGVKTVAMEVSSHALDQGRVNGVDFSVAVWTNLSRDHLDYHRTAEAYLDAKRKLFRWPNLKAAVLNLDDPAWPLFYQAIAPTVAVIGYTMGDKSAPFPYLTAANASYSLAGIEFEAVWERERFPVRVPLLGEFNLANLLAVLAALLARGMRLSEAVQQVVSLQPVPGRMECFRTPGRPLAVVDYAHTPAALELALKSLRRCCQGKLWVVFGCGGERDRGKRPLMGGIAERLADRVILTDDNPRREPGDRIIADICAGMKGPPLIIRDRHQAIAAALTAAGAQDIVLVAGKGHEDYQEIEGRRLPFCDRTVVKEVLQEVSGTCV